MTSEKFHKKKANWKSFSHKFPKKRNGEKRNVAAMGNSRWATKPFLFYSVIFFLDFKYICALPQSVDFVKVYIYYSSVFRSCGNPGYTLNFPFWQLYISCLRKKMYSPNSNLTFIFFLRNFITSEIVSAIIALNKETLFQKR